MKRALLLAAILLFFAPTSRAQTQIQGFPSSPASCDNTRGLLYFNTVLQQFFSCTFPNTWGVFGLPPTPGGIVISTFCGSAANCFQVAANTRWTGDGNITNGSPTVTSNTIAFTQSDVGRTIYTVNPSTGLTKMIGTILSVQSATQATSSANATATENTNTDALCVGTDDTAQLQAAWAFAVSKGGLTILLPVGVMLISAQPFGLNGTPATPFGSYNVVGNGGYGSGTTFVVAPNYNGATQVGPGLVYSFSASVQADTPSALHIFPTVEKFSITALGSNIATVGNGASYIYMNGGIVRDIQIAGMSGPNSSYAVTVGTESRIYNLNCQPQYSGAPAGSVSCIGMINGSGYIDIFSPILAYTGGYCIQILNNIHVNIYGGILVSCGSGTGVNPHASLTAGGTSQNVRMFGVRFNGGVTGGTTPAFLFVDVTAEAECTGCRFETGATGSNAIWVAAGGKLHLRNADLSAVTGSAVGINNLGTTFDECGNISAVSSTPYQGAGNLFGSCSITGIALTTAKLVPSANWGTGAAVSAPAGGTQQISFTITNGSAAVGASPTITYTFPTPFLVAPLWCTATQVGGTNPTGTFASSGLTATSVVFTYSLTPTINDTELVQVVCPTQ